MNQHWNKCDSCGRFVAFADIETGKARRALITPDSFYSNEYFETLCPFHTQQRQSPAKRGHATAKQSSPMLSHGQAQRSDAEAKQPNSPQRQAMATRIRSRLRSAKEERIIAPISTGTAPLSKSRQGHRSESHGMASEQLGPVLQWLSNGTAPKRHAALSNGSHLQRIA